ncbi:RNA polymerase sporulation sigma factor SigF [Caloramator australicus]|uniref:RNA polymerase sigma factor n=1 Tax=Caloramator australicus RC3 TaxID=857293 RepID=I7KVW3_9CLOT|nr:RNA polymerase sporulation sigma factor SigF [Caloramator australicus]CCJ34234.1 RNA polymerase sporulation specific sigma factor SigF [Caloramator australicus RC3]
MQNDSPTKLMDNQEEVYQLILRSQNGDKEAQDILVKNNLGLVNLVIKRFVNMGFEYEDLFQIGCIGLVKAIKNFKVEQNVKFSTYAVPMILGEVRRHLRDDGFIKFSRSMKDTAKKVKHTKEKLFKELGREATIEEIAQELCITTEDVLLSLESISGPEYLYDTIHQDDGSPILLIDRISEDENSEEDHIDKIALKDVIDKLEPKQRQVIILRYFKDLTQSQVAKMLGISQVQVSRIEKKVLNYIKESLK